MAAVEKATFCRICEPLCGMVATVDDGRIVKLRPDPEHPLSRGYACPKGIAMEEVQNDPDRVLYPLKRMPGGDFERVSWEQALADIAARMRDIPPGSVGWYMGNPGAFSYSHTLWVKGFLDGLGSPHYYSAGSQDVNNRFAASALLYGSPLVIPIPDLKRARFLFMVGANPLVSHGSVLSAPRIREQLLEIERVVVVDPRRTETGRQSADPPGHRRPAAALDAGRDLRRGARRPGVPRALRRGGRGARALRALPPSGGDRDAHRRSRRPRT